MHLSLPLIISLTSLLSTISAVDVNLFNYANCQGEMLTCTNLPPNYCCGAPTTFKPRSARYIDKPETSRAIVWARQGVNGPACGYQAGASDNQGSFFCTDGRTTPSEGTVIFAGASYTFPRAAARKRGAAAEAEAGERCGSTVAPDTLVLVDGTRVDIRGMEADQVEAVIRLRNGPSYRVSITPS